MLDCALAADLVARNVDVVVAPGGFPWHYRESTSTTKTIVFEMGGDRQLGVVDACRRVWQYHGGFEFERRRVAEAA
jgi:hypothetical protein